MDTDTSTAKVLVVGIHGVGYANSGTVRSALAAAIGSLSNDVDIKEVYWSDVLDPDNKFDDSLDSHALSRFARSILVAASKDFHYNFFRTKARSPVQSLIQFTDTVCYVGLVAMSLLWSVVLLFLGYLAICYESGYWQYASVAVEHIPIWWIGGILILSFLTIVTGFAVQIGIGGYSYPEVIRVAFRIAARRMILTLVGPFFALPFGIDSGEWLRVVGGLLAIFSLAISVIGPIITFAMATYLRHAGATADELQRVPRGVGHYFLYLVGFGITLGIGSYVWHRAVRPIAKILSDVIVYLGDFRYRQRLLSLATDQLHVSSVLRPPIVLYGHSLGSVIAFDVLRKLATDSKLSTRDWFESYYAARALGRELISSNIQVSAHKCLLAESGPSRIMAIQQNSRLSDAVEFLAEQVANNDMQAIIQIGEKH